MKYSETGQFTKEQIRLAKNISRNIKKLKDTGCTIFAKQNFLLAYLNEDFKHETTNINQSDGYRLKCLDCGALYDSGADDEEYFEEGYITEE